MKFRLLPALFILLSISSGILSAQSDQKTPVPQLFLQWHAHLEQSNKDLAGPNLDDDALISLRGQITEILDGARSARGVIESEAGPLRDELSALGSPPATDAPKESAVIAKKRKALNDHLAVIDGQIKEAELILSRAEEALKQLSAIRIQRFTHKIFRRGFSALAPEVWQKAIPELQEKVSEAKNQLEAWQSSETDDNSFKRESLHLVFALFAVLAVVWPFSRWFSRKFGRTSTVQIPTYIELLRAALTVGLVRSMLPMSITASVYLVLNHDLQWSGAFHDFVFSIFLACLMIILVAAVSRAMLSPFRGRWRLMPLNDNDAHYVHKVIVGLAWVFAIDLVLDAWFTAGGASLELTLLRNFLIGLVIAGLMLALLIRRQLWRMDIQNRRKKSDKAILGRGLRFLIAALVLMIPVSSIAGYVAFSRLLGTQIVLTGGLYVLVGVVIALCTELIEELLSKETEIGSKIRDNLELSDEGSELLVFWLKVTAQSVIYLSAILTLLVIWGAGGEDLKEWLYKALFGFNVAGATISIAALFFAIAIFSGILLLTRLFQRLLELRILPQTRIDSGIQNSIRASVGYIGFIIAAGLAISTLGIDMSKLAIIAGALSVGIGFGLQNVVNNFVSGLILLIERPIKVGDWVVVNDLQGYVKKIKVRATEIQTFDRASVFIPNSNLISNPLLNWTHADKSGRVIVPVGVAYGTDTRKVQKLLLEAAVAHPAVLKSLPPSVLFKGFGDSCLNFELRAFILDVDKVRNVSSDLCFEIDAAFRKEGIEIPYPQQDVHWKDIDRLENLVTKILAEKKA